MKYIFKKIKVGYLKFIKHPLQGAYIRKKTNLTNDAIMPSHSYHYLGLVAIFRGEDDYLIEWIEFHKLMGVGHFILYNNGISQKSYDLLKKYIENGLITYIPFPHVQGLKDGHHADTLTLQQLAYADCIIRFRKHFKYLLQLDLDEFLFPKQEDSIINVLKLLDDKISRIEVNLTNFGSAGKVKKPNGLVIKNFTKSCSSIDPNGLKSIVATKYLSNIFKYSNVHKFSIKYSLVDIIKRILFGNPFVLKGKNANKLFQLNHYITKSKEEFLNKGKIYKDGWQIGKKTVQRFNNLNQNYNEVVNDKIKRFIPKLHT